MNNQNFTIQTEETTFANISINLLHLLPLLDYLDKNTFISTKRENNARYALYLEIERLLKLQYEQMIADKEPTATAKKEPRTGITDVINELLERDKKQITEAKKALREVASTNEPQN